MNEVLVVESQQVWVSNSTCVEFIYTKNEPSGQTIDHIVDRIEKLGPHINIYLAYIYDGKIRNGDMQTLPMTVRETNEACDWIRAHINAQRHPAFSAVKKVLISGDSLASDDIKTAIKQALSRNGYKCEVGGGGVVNVAV